MKKIEGGGVIKSYFFTSLNLSLVLFIRYLICDIRKGIFVAYTNNEESDQPVNPLYTDIRYNDEIRYNDNLNITKHSLER